MAISLVFVKLCAPFVGQGGMFAKLASAAGRNPGPPPDIAGPTNSRSSSTNSLDGAVTSSIFHRLHDSRRAVEPVVMMEKIKALDICTSKPPVILRHRKTERPYNSIHRKPRPKPILRPRTWMKMMDHERINKVLQAECCRHCCSQNFTFNELLSYRHRRAEMGEKERKETLLSELVAMGVETFVQGSHDPQYLLNAKKCCRTFFGRAGEQTNLLKVCVPLARNGFTKVTTKPVLSEKNKETWTYAVLFTKFSAICDKTQVSTARAGRPGLKGRNWHLPMYIRVGIELVSYVCTKWQEACAHNPTFDINDPPLEALIRRVMKKHFPFVHMPAQDDFARYRMV